MQLEPLVAAERPFVARPGTLDAGPARHPVAQVRDRQRVAAGVVVAQDRAEVVHHQERGAPVAGGQQDRRLGLVGQGARAGRLPDTEPAPFRDRLAHRHVCRLVVEPGGQHGFGAPGFAGAPADVAQISSGRAEYVGQAVPQVAAAVAVPVHRVAGVCGRNELGMAHGAGPGADQTALRRVAPVDDPERLQQLLAPEVGPAAVPGERGQRLDHVVVAHVGAEVALHRPDRDDDLGRHPVVALDAREQAALRGELFAAAGDPGLADGAVEIAPDRADEFRLAAVRGQDFRQDAQPGQVPVHRGGADPRGQRIGPEARQPGLEIDLLRRGVGRQGCRLVRGARRRLAAGDGQGLAPGRGAAGRRHDRGGQKEDVRSLQSHAPTRCCIRTALNRGVASPAQAAAGKAAMFRELPL
nr:hypothetical protein [Skermanella pratensis]